MKTQFFPALVKMLTEVEEDNETWAETVDGEEGAGNDIHSAALSAISRLSLDMKETFTLDACKPVFAESFTHADWKVRQAGYLTFGLIAEACKDYLKSNIDNAMQTACKGLQDENIRVRYASLSCLALVLTELSPTAQLKYHQELVPALLNIIQNEQVLKVQTHGISCMINFTQGLI
jgi:HEAT repeat protein